MTERAFTRGRGARHAVTCLAVVIVATLACASTALTIRWRHRAYCSSGTVQYEYEPHRFLEFNSYADVHERLCLTSRGTRPQFVDIRLRVTVQVVIRDVPIFEAGSTWADVTITVDDRVTVERCDFPELSRMTPYALKNGRMGDDGALVRQCRFAVPSGGRVTASVTFHGVERSGPHQPVSGPLSVHREGATTRCRRGEHARRCARVDLGSR